MENPYKGQYLRWGILRTAFFDLDGTIVQGSAGVELAQILSEIENGDSWREFWENQRLFKSESVNYDDAIEILSTYFAKGVRDVETNVVQKAVGELQKRIKIRTDFSELYTWLVRHEFKIFVLTASPIEVFEAIPFRFTEVFGLILERNGKYTGCCIPMTTQAKKNIIKKKRQGSLFSFGVTDSAYDLEAYEELDLIFLLSSSNFYDKECITTKSLIEVKDVLYRKLM